MTEGAEVARFEVWAPDKDEVTLDVGGERLPMERDVSRQGWWAAQAPAEDGTRYGFSVDGGPALPDPAPAASPTARTA